MNSCFVDELHCIVLTEPCSCLCVFSLKKNCDVDCCLAPGYNRQVKRMIEGSERVVEGSISGRRKGRWRGVVVGGGVTRRRSSRRGPRGTSRLFPIAHRRRGSPPFPVVVGAAELCHSARAKFAHDWRRWVFGSRHELIILWLSCCCQIWNGRWMLGVEAQRSRSVRKMSGTELAFLNLS
jgi:hypothetical protein